MTTLTAPGARPALQRPVGIVPDGMDPVALFTVVAGLALLYLPTFWDWAHGVWAAATQGHELMILAVAAWLLYRQRHALVALRRPTATWPGDVLLTLGLLAYGLGRSQGLVRVELVSLILVVAGLLLRYRGRAGLRLAWFPLFFLLFALPLSFDLVLALTAPLKTGASVVATWLLSALGYPVGRSGVVLTIGQYQLLVTEACAGLQTMFTLEAMGLLYASLMNHGSALRNTLLALLVVPVSFSANVLRVMVLAVITYHWGDAAGQGFLHGFAGLLLFLAALLFIMGVDRLLGVLLPARYRA